MISTRLTSIFFFLIFLQYSALYAQQTFDKGYAVQLSSTVKYPRYARTEFPQDKVIAGLLNGTIVSPYQQSSKQTSLNWEEISPDEKSYFNSEKFNYGGLYLEYESNKKEIMILDCSGNAKVYFNGIPREGDHFDYNVTKLPVQIEKGTNSIYLTGGRNPRIKAKLYKPSSPVILSTDQMTLPDLIIEENGEKLGAVMVINATNKPVRKYVLECIIGDQKRITEIPTIERLTFRKVPFGISELTGVTDKEIDVQLNLLTNKGEKLNSIHFKIKNKHFIESHDRTFISKIDGSVQYFSVTPGNINDKITPALFFSVHGAGVEARNQAAAYQPKNWGHIVSPTNRGPFGFAWEDWGRLDALEVLELGKSLFKPNPKKIYLTGHSMGGHASWYLGATYPDYWSAIAPCAGYAELHEWIKYQPKHNTEIQRMFIRANNPQSTKLLASNYLHYGVYVNHGDADPVVSVEHAREMRNILGNFHPDFAYYEYPGGSHWYGAESVDWPPLFEFLKSHKLPETAEVRTLKFSTANPGVSATSNWLSIYQQIHPFQVSNGNFKISEDSLILSGTTQNVKLIKFDLAKAALKFPGKLKIDDQEFMINNSKTEIYLKLAESGKWIVSEPAGKNEKSPHRSGNFKDAFRHNMVFVYGTSGSKEENQWNYYKARFDAESFSYRGNGSIEIIPDKQFHPDEYKDRGIIIYGNADNNKAWNFLLNSSPVQVKNGEVKIGDKSIYGDDLGCYFIQPRPDSDIASVGVVAGSGIEGMKGAHANQYFVAGSAFPDLTVFRKNIFEKEYDAVECTGFFGNDWSVEKGEFAWKGSVAKKGK
ncbi:prolyl oligopeptidase family serine peptidase [Flexithrix dorotheae]|uniref:carboxylesterase family protein n=1 Tax=Flexithrix dorotheae TaxID=70993 RepID=UPI00035DAFD8|nr:prolyl oligopeptidase family serine peptidase [Flexithrix dorotheae]